MSQKTHRTSWLGSWLLNALYLCLLVLASPVLLYRVVVRKKYRTGFREKWLGDVPRRESTVPAVWFHAVSVGEVLQLEPVIEQLLRARPDVEIVISTTTITGMEVARKKYPQHRLIYFPLDFSWAVHRAMDRIRPSAIVLVELELWPNFLRAAFAKEIPVALINGRMSARSYRGYRWLKPLLQPLLRQLAVIAVQDGTYAARLNDLAGKTGGHLAITGSIKFDRVQVDRNNSKTAELRRVFGLQPGERVFIAGSTQDPEERYAVQTWLALREKHPTLRLMLVPRHKERFEDVARMIEQEFRLPLLRRTVTSVSLALPVHSERTPALAEPVAHNPVLLLDTLGELSAAWGLADIAFVGGSLTRRGGQNMLEPAGYGTAVLFGPNTQNFRDIVTLLLDADAARVVRSKEELTTAVDQLLADPALADELGRRAQALVHSHRGATQRTVELLHPLLPEPSAKRAVA